MQHMLATFGTAVALCALLGSPAVARQNDNPSSPPTPDDPSSARPMPDPTSAQPMPDDPSAQSQTKSGKFVQEASANGTAEVKLAQLALEKATNPAVKEFAQMAAKDHTDANNQLQSNAGATTAAAPPDDVAKKQQKTYDKLSQLSGEEFDKAYMDQMVKDHKKAVKLFERQAKSDENPELKAFAAATLPTLERHLDEAERIKDELKGDTPRGTSGTVVPPQEGPRAPGSDEPSSPSPMPDPEPRTDPRP